MSTRTPFHFGIEGDHFVRNGQPHRIFSGALHYFRILPELWEDRLLKCRAMGLNTIDTYVAWNLHEPNKGEFDFSGGLDLAGFIATAARLGLDVIVRPGPYICAEWDLGGFPPWLIADPRLRVRCMDPRYLDAVESYFSQLLPRLLPHLASQGGPIVAVQVENEYGSYGNDRCYLEWLEALYRRHGIDALLFTSDGPEDFMLQGGTLPHLLKTVNFGTRAPERFKQLRKYQPHGPLMCTEFWNGWFDHWGHPASPPPAEATAQELEAILDEGASVNFYMMHGGTNFGLMNGANHDAANGYRPTTTSYDYNAPLDETGNPTRKYHLFRDLLAKHGATVGPTPEITPLHDFGSVVPTASCPLLEEADRLLPATPSIYPCSMEELGLNATFLLYRTHLSGPRTNGRLFIDGLHDHAYLYLDGRLFATLSRNDPQPGVPLDIPPGGARLEIVVENLGRVNYGSQLHDRKGILHGVRYNQQHLFHWEILPLGPALPAAIPWRKPGAAKGEPSFHRAEVDLEEPGDTRLAVEGGIHGIVWVNGFTLGRYWHIGPQETLYIPAPLLRRGHNELVILEFEADTAPTLTLCSERFPKQHPPIPAKAPALL